MIEEVTRATEQIEAAIANKLSNKKLIRNSVGAKIICAEIEAAIEGLNRGGAAYESFGIRPPYIVTRKSLRHLEFDKEDNYGWLLPQSGHQFSSLRRAKVFIKKNLGMLCVELGFKLPGSVEKVHVEGVITI